MFTVTNEACNFLLKMFKVMLHNCKTNFCSLKNEFLHRNQILNHFPSPYYVSHRALIYLHLLIKT